MYYTYMAHTSLPVHIYNVFICIYGRIYVQKTHENVQVGTYSVRYCTLVRTYSVLYINTSDMYLCIVNTRYIQHFTYRLMI